MYRRRGLHPLVWPPHAIASRQIAGVYNQAGADYVAYADGDPEQLFCFDGLHGYADRRLWSLIEKKLGALRTAGASSVTILDAGCGPGTWLRRVVTHAHRLGFSKITARGFDVALAQIQAARRLARDLARLPCVDLTFEVADLLDRLTEPDAFVDVALCLYSVLSHLPILELPKVVAEFGRVTRGCFITTVRSIGSTPTAFVDSIDRARHFKLDHHLDRCEVEFSNGCRIAVRFHLFTAHELGDLFRPHFAIEDLRGLDIFHNRFVPDGRWNPTPMGPDEKLMQQLAQLEEAYATDPGFMERATHLLLVGRREPTSENQVGLCIKARGNGCRGSSPPAPSRVRVRRPGNRQGRP
jgi:SAM-dependent methyltransferase